MTGPSNESNTNSPNARIHYQEDGAKVFTPFMMWTCILAGASLTMSTMCLVILAMYMSKVEVLQLYQGDLKAAMLLHGINPHPHMEGESP